jgi:hypothetical protein
MEREEGDCRVRWRRNRERIRDQQSALLLQQQSLTYIPVSIVVERKAAMPAQHIASMLF